MAATSALLTRGVAAQDADVEAAAWLTGCWVATPNGVVVEEQWMAPRGGLIVGMARSVRGGVATGHEFLLIQRGEAGLVLTASPSGQQPADFVAEIATEQELRFTNPTHDFPKGIEYHRVSSERVVARVFADVDSPDPAFEVHYERVRCRDREDLD